MWGADGKWSQSSQRDAHSRSDTVMVVSEWEYRRGGFRLCSEAEESRRVWGMWECLTELPWSCLVSIWIEMVPQRFLCWNTQVPAGDTVLSGCRTSGRSSWMSVWLGDTREFADVPSSLKGRWSHGVARQGGTGKVWQLSESPAFRPLKVLFQTCLTSPEVMFSMKRL